MYVSLKKQNEGAELHLKLASPYFEDRGLGFLEKKCECWGVRLR